MQEEKIRFSSKLNKDKVWDVIIIGSGPAGLTSAIYTTRGAASSLILAGENWGGQLMLTTMVDNFPGFPNGIQGPELMNLMRRQAERFGAEFVQSSVESVNFSRKPFEIVAKRGNRYLANSVIIATGAETRWLGIPGEDKLRGRGVSSCAPCDAPFFKNKKVAVVGGGDAAMEEALVLTKYASSVLIIHRRDEFRASAAMQTRVAQMEKQGKIKILWNTEVSEMIGDEKLEKVVLKTRVDPSQVKELKRSKLTYLQGKILQEKEEFLLWELPIEGVFVAIGHLPAIGVFQGKVETDERGYIKRYEKEGFSTATSVEGVFVAGDIHDYHYRQAITAAGFGCMAALDVLKYLDKSLPTW